MADRTYMHVSGEFVIEIKRVRADGEMVTSPKKIQATALSSSSIGSSRRGPAPAPYLDKSGRSQRRDEAANAQGKDANALYHAAYKKASTDVRFVMRRMKEVAGLATEIKKWYMKYKLKKGNLASNCVYCKYYGFHFYRFSIYRGKREISSHLSR